MTYEQALARAKENLAEASIETLKESIEIMNNDLDVDNTAFDLSLGVLMSRIDKNEFVSFCDTL